MFVAAAIWGFYQAEPQKEKFVERLGGTTCIIHHG